MAPAPVVVWFRRDLRCGDHPALRAASQRRAPVVPAFILPPDDAGQRPLGAASRWWLHHSLEALAAGLAPLGSPLVLRTGPEADALDALVRETGARTVFWGASIEPQRAGQDAVVAERLRARGLEVVTFPEGTLVDPREMRTGSGSPYKIFTPFWRALASGPEPPAPQPAPRSLQPPASAVRSVPLQQLGLLPRVPWDEGLRATWSPGEPGARRRLADFDGRRYGERRDAPAADATSRLSPHLHWGEISIGEAWHSVRDEPFRRQLAWREFSAHALAHFPEAPDRPLRSEFERFPWRRDARALRAWTRGLTGYPFVDAGMRELWATGWMHGRVRMVVASFLVKHLLVRWQEGERWFWDTLVDADLANNAFSWQWVAGCGHDAAPYFRVFNPVTQGREHDPDAAYVHRWVPELRGLPAPHAHAPWLAPPMLLQAAGVELGRTYPRPVVDHAEARARALEAHAAMRRAAGEVRS